MPLHVLRSNLNYKLKLNNHEFCTVPHDFYMNILTSFKKNKEQQVDKKFKILIVNSPFLLPFTETSISLLSDMLRIQEILMSIFTQQTRILILMNY